MAEQGSRCTRRKQANPRRKNVEVENMPEDVDSDPLGPNPGSRSDPAVSPASSTDATDVEPSARATPSPLLDTSLTIASPLPSSPEALPEPPSSPDPKTQTTTTENSNLSNDLTGPATESSKAEQATTPLVNGFREEEEEASSPVDAGSRSPSAAIADKSEEEKIQEYLRRSDTAVIFPEPPAEATNNCSTTTPSSPTPNGPSSNGPDRESGGDASSKMLDEFFVRCPHCDRSFSGPNGVAALQDHLRCLHPAGLDSRDGTTLPAAKSPVPGLTTTAAAVQPEITADNKFTCAKCGASFPQKEQLEKHELLHSTTNQRHMISHDESSVLRKFKCHECGKAFKFKHHLKEHIRIHSGEKPFHCLNCGKRFSHSGSYSSHMTSKKCLVVNLKVRKIDTKANRGRGNSQQNNTFRPIIPKFGAGGEVPSLNPAGYLPSSERFPFVPEYSSPHLQQQSHQTQQQHSAASVQPFLPTAAAAAYGPLTLQHLLASHFPPHYLPFAPGFSEVAQLLQARMAEKTPTSNGSDGCSLSQKGDFLSKVPVPPSEHAEAVKKILEIMDATVSKQHHPHSGTPPPQQTIRRNGLLPELLTSGTLMPSPREASPSVERNNFRTESPRCRFCNHSFESRVDLYQHERYTCKMNRDINRNENPDSLDLKPLKIEPKEETSSVHGSSDSDEEFGRDNLEEDGANFRPVISEDGQQLLKSHYRLNPRPKKLEIFKLAREIGCTPKIVHIWFKTNRALDRPSSRFTPETVQPAAHPSLFQIPTSQYKPSFPTMSPPSYASVAPPCNGAFIRYPGGDRPPSPSQAVQCLVKFGQNEFNGDNDQPLDLSMKSVSSALVPYQDMSVDNEYQVLNLSQKSPRTSTPLRESNNVARNGICDDAVRRSPSHHILVKPLLSHPDRRSDDTSLLHKLNHRLSPSSPLPSGNKILALSALKSFDSDNHFSPDYHRFRDHYSEHYHHHSHHHHSYIPSTSESAVANLLIASPHPTLSPASADFMRSSASSDAGSREGTNSPHTGPAGCLDGKSSSPYMMDGEDQADGDPSSPKSKRFHKKSWKQVEADESQSAVEDSPGPHDDPNNPGRQSKKRKPWKMAAKGESNEEGMFTCDQCDKMFSKQSSLARHKYEHSGQRPHKCDVCSKAFKHKHHLTEHKRLHSGEKPFQCKKCFKRFSHSGSFSQHMNHRYSYCKPYRE